MVATNLAPSKTDNSAETVGLKKEYLQILSLVERTHRQILDVVKDELDRKKCGDINSVQALLLFNIGDSELTAGELRSRGHYLGSNVSYNLKKLVESGYIRHKRSHTDRRSVRISLTENGCIIRDMLMELFNRQLTSLEPVAGVNKEELENVSTTLVKLERYWSDHIRYRL